MLMFSSVLRKIVVRSGHAWYQIKANDILNRFIQKSLAYQLKQTSIISPKIRGDALYSHTFLAYVLGSKKNAPLSYKNVPLD